MTKEAHHYTVQEILELIREDNVSKFYRGKAWIHLKNKVLKNNHYECVLCKANHKLARAEIVHHVNELKKRPDLAYSMYFIDVDGKRKQQLVPLCFDCHELIHHRGKFSYTRGFVNEERW